MTHIRNAYVYDLAESVRASKFPMATDTGQISYAMTPTALKLANSAPGSGHDNWLMGVRVAFTINLTAKALVEMERYHFLDIVSCTSTMHRIAKFDLDEAFCEYVDQRIIGVVKELACAYNADPTPENYLKLLYSVPSGFTYTLRVTTNYRQLKTIYAQRRAHRLPEWREICQWIETLPHSELITGGTKE